MRARSSKRSVALVRKEALIDVAKEIKIGEAVVSVVRVWARLCTTEGNRCRGRRRGVDWRHLPGWRLSSGGRHSSGTGGTPLLKRYEAPPKDP